MRLSEIQNKDIININDGKKIGKIIDADIDSFGKLNSLISEKYRFFLSLFSSKSETEIKWQQIEKIGTDVILVNLDNTHIEKKKDEKSNITLH